MESRPTRFVVAPGDGDPGGQLAAVRRTAGAGPTVPVCRREVRQSTTPIPRGADEKRYLPLAHVYVPAPSPWLSLRTMSSAVADAGRPRHVGAYGSPPPNLSNSSTPTCSLSATFDEHREGGRQHGRCGMGCRRARAPVP